MEFIAQSISDILDNLEPIESDWQDETARRVIGRFRQLPVKPEYDRSDIKALFEPNFDEGILMARLFLGLPKDQAEAALRENLGDGGTGVKRFRRDPDAFVSALEEMGLLEAMRSEISRELHWTDTLVERLRSGRGSAISGQHRGRALEDFVERMVREVFGNSYAARCQFEGSRGRAKCDFAIPSKLSPRILIEAKGYGATGSKMTDIIGDIEKIISAKRPDTALFFVTDGMTWNRRQNDLRKLVGYQNQGMITRIYTRAMAGTFGDDLRRLRSEYKLEMG